METLLPRSNIGAFGRRFAKLTIPNKGRSVFNFVFHKPNMDFSIAELPENTKLEKALKQHYSEGKAIYAMVGFFINKE